MSQSTITFLVLAAVVVVFVWDRIPVAVVAIGTALSLWATGVLDLEQALAGFGDPTVLFIASLFVVSEALEATGVTALVGPGADRPRRERPHPGRRADDGGRRPRHGVHHRQRLRRRADPRGRPDGRPPPALAVAAADAGRLRRARRLAARAHRHAGQRDHLGLRRRRRGRALRLLRVRPRRNSPRGRDDPDRRAARAPAAAGAHSAGDHARLQRPRPDARRALRAGGRSGPAAHPRIRRGRGRDPAALGADRRGGVPRHGHGQRRPRRPRRPAEGRGARRRVHARRRRCAPASGRMGRAGVPSRRPRCARRRRARARAAPGRPAGDGREAGARDPRSGW